MSSHIALSVSPLWQPSHSSKVAKSKGQAARSVPFRSTVGGSSCISSQQDFPFHARHRPTFKNPTPLQKNSPHPIHSFHTRRQPSPSFLRFRFFSSSPWLLAPEPRVQNSPVGAQTPNPSRPPGSAAPAGGALRSPPHAAGGPRAEHAGSRAMATGPDLSSSSGAAAKKDRHIVSWSAEVRL